MAETKKMIDPFLNKEVEISTRLIDRLNGKYSVGPMMPNGEPEFGWHSFEVPPIQKEAAATISRLTAERDEFKAQADALNRDVWKLGTERDGLRKALEALNEVAPAVENLACHQEQCDMDGVMVKVSRQAVDEVVSAINAAVCMATPPLTLAHCG